MHPSPNTSNNTPTSTVSISQWAFHKLSHIQPSNMANLLYTASRLEAMEGTAHLICILKLRTRNNLIPRKRDQLSLIRSCARLVRIEIKNSPRVRFRPLSSIESRKRSSKTSRNLISVSAARVAQRSV